MLVPIPHVNLLPIPLYIGPDQFLPITSALGAILGFLMLFWVRVRIWANRVGQLFTRKKAESPTGPDAK